MAAVKRYWPLNEVPALVLACSAGAVISLLLGFGGYTQQIFVNGVLGDASSFYEALTPSGIVKQQTFIGWVGDFFFWGYLPLSIFACLRAFRQRTVREIFLTLTLGVFLVLSVVDTVFAFFYDSVRDALGECYLSNALGSPLIAFVGCLLVLGTKAAHEHLTLPRTAAYAVVPLGLGGLLFLILFVLVKNFFWVTSSEVSALVSPPINGNYSLTDIDAPKGERFGLFLNEKIPPDKLSWIGMATQMGIGVANSGRLAVVKAYLYEGCPGESTADMLKARPEPFFQADQVAVIGFGVDDGMIDFSIHSESGSEGHWKASEETVSMFSINAAEEAENLDLTLFISEGVRVEHLGWSGEAVYRGDLFAFDDAGLRNRTVAIVADEVSEALTISPDPNMRVQDEMVCKPIASGPRKTLASSPLVTVLVSVAYPPAEKFSELGDTNMATVRGINGWLSAKGVGAGEISDYVSAGVMQMLSVQGRFEEIYIDGEKLEPRRQSWLYLQEGKISGSIEESSLRINGVTDIAMLDGSRATKTRWERIGLAVKSLIVSVPAMFLWFFGIFWAAWKRNDHLVADA